MASTTTTFLLLILISLFSTILTPSIDAQTMPPMATAESPSMAMSPTASSGPATSGGMDDCMTVLINMSSCLTFVEQGSKLGKPDKECCPSLAGLLESNPICLCQLLGDPGKTGVQIDVNRALKLPNICGLQTPPVSTCAALGIPVAAPTIADVPAASPGGIGSSSSGEVPAGSPGKLIKFPLKGRDKIYDSICTPHSSETQPGFASSPTPQEKNNGASIMAFFKIHLALGLGIMYFTTSF